LRIVLGGDGTLTVERREFSTTKSGKINYLHA